MLNDLKELIAIPSVLGTPRDGAPFGEGPRAALDCFLRIASSYGMRVHDEHGYCGWAEIGEGEKMLGILGHLDVVPAGKGWSHDPFALTIQDGLLYGRGVADDKGPTVAALHAMVRLLREGAPLKHRIRLIAGCNEENGSECIQYYREHCEIPAASFVPDADFPIINSEKGILHLRLRLPLDAAYRENLREFRAGVRPNIVPDGAVVAVPRGCALYDTLAALGKDNSIFSAKQVATILVRENLRIQDFSVHFFEDKLLLEARGVAGHAMDPAAGENAAYKLFSLLHGLLGESNLLGELHDLLCRADPAEALGIACKDEISGALTVNLGVVEQTDDRLTLTLDCRLPVCADFERVAATVAAKFSDGNIEVLRHSPNLYIPKESPLIGALLDAYTAVTGEQGECLYCGGGTYARELPNAVAFGPTFPGLETRIHNVDESFPVVLFERLPDIYYEALVRLSRVM